MTDIDEHLVIACGGTGGHFYPTLAIAKEFQKTGGRVTLMISGAHADEQMALAKENGIDAVRTEAERLSSKNPLKILKFGINFLRNAWQARRQLRDLDADLLLGMGSYASLPTCFFKPKWLPLFLHEGNAFMGKANRFLAIKATAIGLSLPLAFKTQVRHRPFEIVGMPLRESLEEAAKSNQPDNDYLLSLGLKPNTPTLLIFGGSQGAQFINILMSKTAQLFFGQRLQIIHLTGTDDNSELLNAYAEARITASVRKAEPNIEKCYLAASLVICRGGASTLCELALFSKPAIIIPLPSAADNHQAYNALLAEKVGGAIFMPQNEATPQSIADKTKSLLNSPARLAQMAQGIHTIAKPNAAQNMVRLMLGALGY